MVKRFQETADMFDWSAQFVMVDLLHQRAWQPFLQSVTIKNEGTKETLVSGLGLICSSACGSGI